MANHTTYHADSDADDEYERSVMTSPILPTDDDTSPTESDPPSTEPTPTFGRQDTDKLSPDDSIMKWTIGQCADYVSSLGLSQYCDTFLGRINARRKTREWKLIRMISRERNSGRGFSSSQT